MTKDLSKMYEIRSASSMVEKRPTDNMNETVQTMHLFDDILKMKGHPRSENLKNEEAYTKKERLDTIFQLMELNPNRKQGMWTYKTLLEEKDKWRKAEMTSEARAWLDLRKVRFERKLQQLMEPATGDTIDLKIKYGSLIPRPELFEGKGRLIGKSIWVKRPILWSLVSKDLYPAMRCLGEVSQRALEVINSSSLSTDYEFDVVEEWKNVPIQSGWKNSDVKRQVRVVIEYCRY